MASVVTTLRDAQGRAIVSLPIAVRQALMQADDILRLHGIQFELICEACHERYAMDPNAWTVVATHGGDDGALNGLVCRCSRRQFVSLM